MAEIILVRHGQANSSATDEASYDQLSSLGHRQAAWLGEHFRATNPHFDHVVCGDMRRHKETASGIGYAAPEIDARWNELSYFALSNALEHEVGVPHPSGGSGFIEHVDQVFLHWRRGQLKDVPESYALFDARVNAALQDITARAGRSLVVTSTGVICMVLRGLLELEHRAHMKLLVQTANTSIHRIEALRGVLYLAEFGATPHLDHAQRRAFRTHY